MTFVVPKVQGGGRFRKGEVIINRGIRPKVIFVVYEGQVRQCRLVEAEKNTKLRIGSFYE